MRHTRNKNNKENRRKTFKKPFKQGPYFLFNIFLLKKGCRINCLCFVHPAEALCGLEALMLSGCVTSSLHSKRVCPSSRCLLGASWQILGISWSPLPPSAGQGGNRHRNGPATLVAPVSLRKKWMCVCVCVRLRLK